MTRRRLEDAGAWLEAQGKLAALATTMREGGWSRQDAARAVNGLNAHFKTHDADELKQLVRKAYSANGTANSATLPASKNPGGKTGRVSKMRELDVAHMARTDPPPVDFLVEGMVARGEVTELWGLPGRGKSLIAQAFARGVALGEPVAGLECKQGHVVYIDAENGPWEIHRRIRSLGLPEKRVAIYDAVGLHVVEDLQEIRQHLTAKRPALVVLDAYRRLIPGWDENDSDAAAQAVAAMKGIAQEFECGVLLIHHAKKDGSNSRGSSALGDQVTIEWQLTRSEGDPDKSRRALSNRKMRIGPEPDDLHIRIVFSGDGSVDILAADEPEPVDPLASGPKRAEVAAQLVDALGEGPLARSALAKAVGRPSTDGTLKRALEDLVERGFIEEAGRSFRLLPLSKGRGKSG